MPEHRKPILHLVSSAGFFGVENVVIELAKVLNNSGSYRPIVGVLRNAHNPHTEIADVADGLGIQTAVFECRGRLDLGTIGAIKRFVSSENVALIHSHQYKANTYTFAATRSIEVTRVTTCHLYDRANYGPMFTVYAWLDKLLLRKFDFIVTTSSHIEQDLRGKGIDPQNLAVIHNGIDPDRFAVSQSRRQMREQLGIGPAAKVVGTVGRLCAQKNHWSLLQSVPQVLRHEPEARLLIVGDGPLRQDMESEIDRLGLRGKVVLTGIRNDIPELMAAMDIFALPSLDEGLPMAMLEAMAAKLPVITTAVGAIPDVVKQGDTGLIIDTDPGSISEAILRLTRDPEFAAELAQTGYEAVRRGFTNSHMALSYLQVYESILN